MLYIEKQGEPQALIQNKRNGVADYESLSGAAKEAIYESLLAEQHSLCAYCMRRIERGSMQIEHYIAQHPTNTEYHAALTIDYKNLLGVCPGNKGHDKKYLTCDQSRGNTPLTVNPLRLDSIQKIKYSSNGRIFSDDEAINYDLNKVLNLNLNCAGVQLVSNRKAALDALKHFINQKCKGKAATSVQLCQIMEKFNGEVHQKEYLGILNDYLQRKINALN